MKKIHLLIIFIMVLAAPLMAFNLDFNDIRENDQYAKEIMWFAENKVIEGYSDNTFKPDQPVNRAEFLKMLYLSLELGHTLPAGKTNAGFNDVQITWYTPYIEMAKQRGTIDGYPDGSFKPAQSINRVEGLKIIANEFFGENQIDSINTENWFSKYNCLNDTNISDLENNAWYAKYLAIFNNYCAYPESMLINISKNNYHFVPAKYLTRAEIAALLYRAKSIKDNNTEQFSDDLIPNPIDPQTIPEPPETVENAGLCGANPGQLFGPDFPWNQTVDSKPLDSESDAIIAFLQSNRDEWGTFQIDGPSEDIDSHFGLTILSGKESDRQGFTQTDAFYSPDCDPAPMPIPEGGAIEGESGFECNKDGDCHNIVVVEESCRLYEMWRCNVSGNTFYGGCQAIWDLNSTYDENLRGDCCTSADAAGLPIAPLVFTADEIAAGEINHAIRFVLPNDMIRNRIYVRPATHSTGATSGPDSAPPYGVRLRLKADFDDSQLNDAGKVVASALKKYGMILADGGNITFTAANDRFTENKWANVGLGPHDLMSLDWTDFEVVELGERFTWDSNCNCNRTPITY